MTIDKNNLIEADQALAKVSLADVIESIREEKGLKMIELCELLGVKKQYYSDFLKGRTVLSVKTAALWAQKIGEDERVLVKCAIDDLLHRNNLNYSIELLTLPESVNY